jgi:FixJ family two-component response regulator
MADLPVDGTVFIVDDDEAVRDSLKLLLEAHGLHVKDYASCGAFVRDYRAGGRECLVLDYHMPGMTGLDLVESLDRTARPLPVILVTGRGDNTIQARAEAAGVLAYLEKPVTENRLLPLIHQALGQA